MNNNSHDDRAPTFDADRAHELLSALGEQLQAHGRAFELVVIGGSALLALGLVRRPTADVDVVAFARGNALDKADPFPAPLAEATERVARDFRVPSRWLNPGPASLVDFGLPEGFMRRATRRAYGPALTVHFASRFDQVHLKLYATVDQGPGRHEADLRALDPSADELRAAARWAQGHDPSEGFAQVLDQVLQAFGVQSADHDA